MLEPTKERAAAAAFRQTPPWSERTVRFRDWRGTGFQHPGGLNATDAEWITFGLPTPRPVHTQLLRKVCDGDEEGVRALLALAPADQLQCAGESIRRYPPLSRATPFDLAVRRDHIEIALLLLQHAGAGDVRGPTHPEVVPTACVRPEGLFYLVGNSADLLFYQRESTNAPSGGAWARRRDAHAAVLRILVRSTMPVVTRVGENVLLSPAAAAESDPFAMRGGGGLALLYPGHHVELVDLRVPGAVRRRFAANSLLLLAIEVADEDLIARLYLLGARPVDAVHTGLNMPANHMAFQEVAQAMEMPEPRRALARAVVRTLLRRHVRRRAIAFYWMGEVAKRRYAAPTPQAFEAEMAAPVFSAGQLGA